MFEEGVVARVVFEEPRGDELDDFVSEIYGSRGRE